MGGCCDFIARTRTPPTVSPPNSMSGFQYTTIFFPAQSSVLSEPVILAMFLAFVWLIDSDFSISWKCRTGFRSFSEPFPNSSIVTFAIVRRIG